MRNIIEYTNSYINQNFEVYQVNYRRKKVIEVIKSIAPHKVLEIGCAKEPLFLFTDPEIIWTIVEPSEQFYINAINLKNELNRNNINIINDFLENSVDKIKTGYDLIICSGLLHEVEDPIFLLSCIKNLAEFETIIHVNVPNANSFHRILAKESGLIDSVFDKSDNNIALQQHTIFDLDKLMHTVKELGAEIIDKGSYFIKPFTHRQMQQMIDSHIIDETILDGLYNLSEKLPELGSEIYINMVFK